MEEEIHDSVGHGPNGLGKGGQRGGQRRRPRLFIEGDEGETTARIQFQFPLGVERSEGDEIAQRKDRRRRPPHFQQAFYPFAPTLHGIAASRHPRGRNRQSQRLHLGTIAADALAIHRAFRGSLQARDRSVTRRGETSHAGSRGPSIVEDNGRGAKSGCNSVDKDQRNHRPRQVTQMRPCSLHRRHNHSIHSSPADHGQNLFLHVNVLLGVRDQHGVTTRSRNLLHATAERRKERIRDIRHDETERVGRVESKRTRLMVDRDAQPLSCRQHPSLSIRADPTVGPLAAKYPGDGRRGKSQTGGELFEIHDERNRPSRAATPRKTSAIHRSLRESNGLALTNRDDMRNRLRIISPSIRFMAALGLILPPTARPSPAQSSSSSPAIMLSPSSPPIDPTPSAFNATVPGLHGITWVADQVPAAVADRQAMQSPERVRLGGWVGQRIALNESNRLAQIDLDRLLEAFRHRPGRQTWEGEHIGKWLHAASLAWANTGDPALRSKLELAVTELSRCQLDDGYLGTYLPDKRWTEWDVWAHKYHLLGLLAYMRHTGDLRPLSVCRRMADLLCRDFGDGPEQRDLAKAGFHTGMAPLSILEPMVLLFRFTNEPRYLEFARYTLRQLDQSPHGPKLISTLLNQRRVDQVGNAKAYEMLSCLNGVLEMYRLTGDPHLLQASVNAWEDIVANRLYLTGASSYLELFRDNHDLPNYLNVGETCVTVTWLQFNAQLLRLTGEARYAEQLERVILNQLIGAQSPDCKAWGYYVQMRGRKPYSSSLTGHCCLSSGPRGIALIPTFAMTTDATGIVVNLYDAGNANLPLGTGNAVSLAIETTFPQEGRIRITVTPQRAERFGIKLRLPSWSPHTSISVNGLETPVAQGGDGYGLIERAWNVGDVIEVQLTLRPKLVVGDHLNAGRVAFQYGPLVLAADESLLPSEADSLGQYFLTSQTLDGLDFAVESAPAMARTWAGSQVFKIKASVRRTTGNQSSFFPTELRLRPFAEAGAFGSRYDVWLPLAERSAVPNVLIEGAPSFILNPGAPEESVATVTNVDYLNDEEPHTIATVSTPTPTMEAAVCVQLRRPALVRRVTFAHGLTLRNGGWFDTTLEKPILEIQKESNGPWIRAGVFADYPDTRADDGSALTGGQSHGLDRTWKSTVQLFEQQTFAVTLTSPEEIRGLRIRGRPSQSPQSGQGMISCAEVQAFAE